MKKINKSSLGYELNKEYTYKITNGVAVVSQGGKLAFTERIISGDADAQIKAAIAIYDRK